MKKIEFGTGGFRGVVEEEFNETNVRLIAQGIANVIIKKQWETYPVVVGYDNRLMSEDAACYIAEVLTGNSIKVQLYAHSVPTPMVMLATAQEGNKIGIMITASHNPYNYNGVKVCKEGGYDADKELTDLIESLIPLDLSEVKCCKKITAWRNNLIESFVNDDEYKDNLAKYLLPNPEKNRVKVLFNNLYGTAVVTLKNCASLLNLAKFDILHGGRDINFGGGLPNPTKKVLGEEFFQTVAKNYDIGIATDSDGDRLGISDEKGNYVNANEILAAVYYYLIKYRGLKGDVVRNICTSSLIDKVATKLGYQAHECDVGFKNVTKAMDDHNALIGGESSGGLTMKDYIRGKDSTFSSCLFLEMVCKMKKPVSEIIKEVKDFAGYSSCYLEDAIALKVDKNLVFNYIRDNLPIFDEKITRFQELGCNYKFFFGEDWLVIRLSGTEPTFRLVVEASSKEKAERLISNLKKYIDDVQSKL